LTNICVCDNINNVIRVKQKCFISHLDFFLTTEYGFVIMSLLKRYYINVKTQSAIIYIILKHIKCFYEKSACSLKRFDLNVTNYIVALLSIQYNLITLIAHHKWKCVLLNARMMKDLSNKYFVSDDGYIFKIL